MRYNAARQEYWICRREQEGFGEPVGDPLKGVAFGQKNDVGTAVSAGASILGGAMGSDAAESAAAGQAAAAGRAAQMTQEQYDQLRKDLAPYLGIGTNATNKLSLLLGLTPSDYTLSDFQGSEYVSGASQPGKNAENLATQAKWLYDAYKSGKITADEARTKYGLRDLGDVTSSEYGSLLKNFTGDDLQNEPGYQFGLSEGEKALGRRASAAGGYFSGAALKAAQRYGQDYAGTKYGEAFNRDAANKNRIYSMLSGTSGTGLNAASTLGSAGMGAANAMGNALMGGANATAAGQIGSYNALSSGLTGASNAFNWNQLLSKLPGNSSPSGYSYGNNWFD